MQFAQDTMGDYGVQFVSGQRFLGWICWRSNRIILEFVQSKVGELIGFTVLNVCPCRAAEVQPQAAHVAMIHSLQFEWSFCHKLSQITALLLVH